jgi:exonuclease SbcD
MRLLHTADWHLGRPFHGASLLEHQAAFLSWLAELAAGEQIDAVLVAGDVYDRALPPGEAVSLASDGFAQLAAGARQVVVIPGNHDSAQRLAFGAPLLSRAGLHLLTDPERCGEPVHVGPAAIYGIPYLEPELAGPRLGCVDRGHGAVLGAAMEQVRTAHTASGGGRACIVMAHAFVAGCAATASERELAVGGAAQVGAGTFAGADYVALGHLHRSQATVGGRYAGSPLAFSFSEAADVKSVTILELEGSGPVRTRTVPCPVPRALTRVRGALDELLADPELAAHEADWIEATLTDVARPLDAMARLQARFPHAVSLVFEPVGGEDGAASTYGSRLRGLSEEEVLDRFVLDVRGTPGEPAELALLGEALAAGRAIRLERQRH